MNRTDSPAKQPKPFGINGQREPLLPTTPSGDNTASYEQGFPPITMILKSAGGLPPKGQDMNQILFELSSLCRWFSAGAINTFDSSFSLSIGGYPKGAMLISDDLTKIYISTNDSNSNNPNSESSGWIDLLSYLGLANVVIGDSVKHIGFSTNDVKKPYFRFPDTDTVILLATQQEVSAALDGKQDSDATLSALAVLTGAANKLAYFTGADTASLTDLTQVGRDIIGKSDIAAVIQYLGLANAVIGDGTKNAGFSGGDAAKPYMRHTQSDSVIFLATTSQLIGIGQAYRVVTDKVLGVTYTNTSKQPWVVSLKVNLPASAEVLIKVDGVMAGGGNAANNAGTSVWAYPSAIIPPGSTYVVTAPGGTLIQWVELK